MYSREYNLIRIIIKTNNNEDQYTENIGLRLGAGATEVCTNNLLDLNKNRKWDCGTDDIQINCPPSVKYMWDFVAN